MLARLRGFIAHRKQVKLEKLLKLAAHADEILMTEKLQPSTRALIEKKREELEDQIREMMAAAVPALYSPARLLGKEQTDAVIHVLCGGTGGQGVEHPGTASQHLDHGEDRRRTGLPRFLPGVQAVLASAAKDSRHIKLPFDQRRKRCAS